MNLYSSIFQDMCSPVILCFTGGGGKTSALYTLASQAAENGEQVLASTSTMMIDPARDRGAVYDRIVCSRTLPPPLPGITYLYSNRTEDGTKVRGPEKEIFNTAGDWDLLLIEADGAKRRPLKAPAEHEPCIPESCNLVIGCIGLDILGKPLCDRYVHRPELVSRITGLREGDRIAPAALVQLATHPKGVFKGAPSGARRLLLLNKRDLLIESPFRSKEIALEMVRALSGEGIERVITSSLANRQEGVDQYPIPG